ncbi:uncharacterized protein LOC115928883 [Strongylocentrotus purpuratus]|uniref:Uncharacterized protein n=1 Tax=Strongylocentrotus purpuratus TaxID=7668 RepID=A0A7M7PKE8_STRPU|nr:uncharacterized protein LOC115928883 [Strongylocentrotus purpuratus]
MASFVNPNDSYTASTTVTVTCDNGNDQAEWICNAFTGNWDEEPIDCSDQSSDQPIAIYAGIGGGVSLLVLLLCICACVYWTKRKPQRPSVATPVRSAALYMTAVYTAGAQPGVVTMPAQAGAMPGNHATSFVNQTVPYHPGQAVAMPGNHATSSVNQTVPYHPGQAGAMPGNHSTSSVNQTVPYHPGQAGDMPGKGDKKQLESEYETSLDAMNGPSGAAAYPEQYPGQPGAPHPYFTNPQNVIHTYEELDSKRS